MRILTVLFLALLSASSDIMFDCASAVAETQLERVIELAKQQESDPTKQSLLLAQIIQALGVCGIRRQGISGASSGELVRYRDCNPRSAPASYVVAL